MNIIQGADKPDIEITIKKKYGSEFSFANYLTSGDNVYLELRLVSGDTLLQKFSLNAESGYSVILPIEYVNGVPTVSTSKDTNIASIIIIGENTANVTGQTYWKIITKQANTGITDGYAEDIFCINDIYIKACT